MATNYGKNFETIIRKGFQVVPQVSIDRLHDQMSGYRGSHNLADYIVYYYPHQYYIECKSVHGNTLPFSNISVNQYEGLLDKANILGVRAGIMCWWVDKDVTKWIPIQVIYELKRQGKRSIRYDWEGTLLGANCIEIKGRKKRVFFEYDMKQFLDDAWEGGR